VRWAVWRHGPSPPQPPLPILGEGEQAFFNMKTESYFISGTPPRPGLGEGAGGHTRQVTPTGPVRADWKSVLQRFHARLPGRRSTATGRTSFCGNVKGVSEQVHALALQSCSCSGRSRIFYSVTFQSKSKIEEQEHENPNASCNLTQMGLGGRGLASLSYH